MPALGHASQKAALRELGQMTARSGRRHASRYRPLGCSQGSTVKKRCQHSHSRLITDNGSARRNVHFRHTRKLRPLASPRFDVHRSVGGEGSINSCAWALVFTPTPGTSLVTDFTDDSRPPTAAPCLSRGALSDPRPEGGDAPVPAPARRRRQEPRSIGSLRPWGDFPFCLGGGPPH